MSSVGVFATVSMWLCFIWVLKVTVVFQFSFSVKKEEGIKIISQGLMKIIGVQGPRKL